MADISQIKLPNGDTFDIVDEKSGYITGMVILSYGTSTWADFLAAYNVNKVVYCRASSNSNPASGSQTRLAFMAYVNNAESPTEVEFQYYRSVSSHSDSQQGDQVFVYKLTSAGTWTVTTREASTKIAVDGDLTKNYSNGILTISGDIPTVPTNVSSFTNDAGYLTSSDIASVLRYKGTKASYSALPSSGNVTGDVWHLTDTGAEWAWDGSAWQELGTAIDLSDYLTSSDIAAWAKASTKPTYTAAEVGAMSTSHAANGITSTDISNWNAKVSDDKTWNGVSLNKDQSIQSNFYVPILFSINSTTANLIYATSSPTSNRIVIYDSNAYLYSTTPSANDNSTKVATTAYVDAAIPDTSGFLTLATLPIYDGTVV